MPTSSLNNFLLRATRRASAFYPSKTLPLILMNLFDATYFPDKTDTASLYASLLIAHNNVLKDALLRNIIMYFCEWDILVKESKDFEERLRGIGRGFFVRLFLRGSILLTRGLGYRE